VQHSKAAIALLYLDLLLEVLVEDLTPQELHKQVRLVGRRFEMQLV